LLRILQEREFERVGGTETIKVDVRIIAATNRNVEDMVKEGKFREDLFYRLNVFPIKVPNLRERKDDIPLFIDHFLQVFSREMNRKLPPVTREALQMLSEYNWPGNVRELANVLERAVIMSTGIISPAELPGLSRPNSADLTALPEGKSLKEIMQQFEKTVIDKTLAKYQGNRVQTAKVLDISRRALQYKIEQYGL
jgi:two-component system response regulator AtoC